MVENRKEKYIHDFLFMSMELYNVIYKGHNPKKLDLMLKTLRENYTPIKSDTICLEYSFNEVFYSKYYTEAEKNIIKSMDGDKDFSIYCKTNFEIILSKIYRMERTYTLPSFINGEFTKFISELCITPHNNISYVDCVYKILDAVKEYKPSYYDIIRNSIINISRFDRNSDVDAHFRYSEFARWFKPEEYIDFVGRNHYIINQKLEGFVDEYFTKEKIDEEAPFIYYTTLNVPHFYSGVSYMKAHKKYQLKLYKDLSLKEVQGNIAYLENEFSEYKNIDLECYKYEIEILNEAEKRLLFTNR